MSMKANERTFHTTKYPEAEDQSTLYDQTDCEPTRTLIQLFQYSSACYRNSTYAKPTRLSTLTPWGITALLKYRRSTCPINSLKVCFEVNRERKALLADMPKHKGCLHTALLPRPCEHFTNLPCTAETKGTIHRTNKMQRW